MKDKITFKSSDYSTCGKCYILEDNGKATVVKGRVQFLCDGVTELSRHAPLSTGVRRSCVADKLEAPKGIGLCTSQATDWALN